MSRRLPVCAWCDRPLAHAKARVLITAHLLPGKPTFGWHIAERHGELACDTEDGLAWTHWRERCFRETLAALLRRNNPALIISAGKQFWDEREKYA